MSDFPIESAVILAAAASLNGDSTSQEPFGVRVAARAADLAALLIPGSDAMTTVGGILGPNTKRIHGWIQSVEKEDSSNRAIVTMVTKPHPTYNPEGEESARTERLDTAGGKRVANHLNHLIGHSVILLVELQEFEGAKGKSKVRVAQHAIDLGVAPRPVYPKAA